MADEQTSQHTRVLVVNGQTIIVQEDAEVDSVSEINGDLLQQALQEVSTSDQAEGNNYPSAPIPETEETDNSNFVAIFQGDQGETHTIQLTVEQAEALGLHFSVDDEKEIHGDSQENGADDSNLYISDEQNNPLLFSGSSKPSNNGPMFSNEMDTEKTCQEMVQNSRMMGNNSNAALENNCENMGMIPSTVNSLMDEQNQPITLIPQFLDGQMTYTVKIQNQSESSILQDQEYTNINANIKYMTLQQSNDNATLSNITDFGSSAIQPICSSASINTQANPVYTTSLPSAVVQQSCSLPVKQTVSLTNSYQNTRTSVTYVPSEKDTKVSYVILPDSSTNTNTLVAPKTVSNNNLSRLSTTYAIASNKNESLNSSGFLPSTVKSTAALPVLSAENSETSIAVSVPSTSLAAASKLNSNAVIVSSSGILSTTPAGSGMIRVVASTPTNSLTQAVPSYAKFSTIRTAAGNQLTTTTTTTTSTTTTTTTSAPKIVSISTSAATVQSEAVSSMVSAAFTRMPVPNFNSAKPLGSCENPIQLVQHGQTFHSMQSLTQEQLRQIATVLQQQQNLEAPSRTKNVVYDEQTNTRIIYRVVYPEDLDLRDPRSPSDNKSIGSGASSTVNKGRGRRGRPPKSTPRGGIRSTEGRRVGPTSSSADMDFDEDRLILDDSAKGERKKQLARTRSGRLSRPPRHMVKDYKRLHHLDFADADLDDSDGGYSDYQMSEHETEENTEKPNSNKDLLPGLSLPKRKISSHFRCPTCQKVYLGYSRMSRHFEMYPDHGNIEQIQMPNKNNINDTKNDENQQTPTPDIISNEALTKVSINNAPTTIVRRGLNGIVRTGPARRRGKRRGPWAYTTPEARSERRKGKLREVLATCEAHELAEVAGPAVAEVLSLWELLLLRVEAVRTEESYVATLCDELQALLEKVRAVASDILKPLDDKIVNKEHQIELQDELLCTTLGVAMGTYLVDDTKLQRMESVDEPAQKRIRLMDDTTAVEESMQKENEISNSTSNDKIYDKCNVRAAKPNVVHCPEILSSLTLVTKQPLASIEHDRDRLILPSRTSSSEDKKVTGSASPKGGDFILSGESSDACPKLNVSVKSVGDISSEVQMPVTDQPSSEFSNASDQQTHDIQTVDDIVNERLKNLTSDSSLVDFTTPTIGIATSSKQQSSVVSSHDLIDRLEQYHSLPSLPADMPGGAVSTFDPEIALAAMGEGDQGSATESAQHFSNTLQQMEDVQSDSSTTFDPEAALAAMGEGEQSSAQDPQPPFHNSMQKTYTAGNSSQVSHTQFQDPVPQMDGMTSDQRQSFDPEIALAAMGEGEQTGDGSTTAQFQSIRIGTSEETFDPEAALAAIGEGEQSAANSANNTFLSDQVTVSKASDNVNGFDALTAISQRHSAESSHISYPSGTASGSSDSSFHPELALADITEVRSVQTTVPSEGSTSVSIVNSGTFHLQCAPDLGLADASMDVSLDESGPELDFEALSEEFNRNTRHR